MIRNLPIAGPYFDEVKVLRWLGVFLVILCAAGFLTVADDLRHIGEIVGVSLIGIAGFVLIIVARRI